MDGLDRDDDDEFFESLMQRYTDAWNRGDVDAIESYYNDPFFSYKEGRLELYLDRDESREIDLAWIEVNRREGPATWERVHSTFQRLGPEQRAGNDALGVQATRWNGGLGLRGLVPALPLWRQLEVPQSHTPRLTPNGCSRSGDQRSQGAFRVAGRTSPATRSKTASSCGWSRQRRGQ